MSSTALDEAASPRPVLGVLGTLVWDTLHPYSGPVVRGWGGIGFSLAALEWALPKDWTVLPLIRVGSDLADSAEVFLNSFPRVETAGVWRTERPNNRVTLRYQSPTARTEVLRGGVGPWTVDALAPLARRCDALYVNFISGFEVTLDTLHRVRPAVRGPVFADLHSLFLDVDADGLRVPRPLVHADAWLEVADMVQVNADEAALLRTSLGTSDLVSARDDLTLVETGGEAGATIREGGRVVRVPARSPEGPASLDPTGCGDTFGAAFFARRLAGDGIEAAGRAAAQAAAVKLGVRGAEALRSALASVPPRSGAPA